MGLGLGLGFGWLVGLSTAGVGPRTGTLVRKLAWREVHLCFRLPLGKFTVDMCMHLSSTYGEQENLEPTWRMGIHTHHYLYIQIWLYDALSIAAGFNLYEETLFDALHC